MRFPALVALGLAVAAPVCAAGDDPPPLPVGVAGHAAAASSGALWIAGGSHWDGDVKRIEAAVRRWRTGEGAWETRMTIPGGFAHGGFAPDGDTLWLAGGFDAHGPSATLRQLDLTRERIVLERTLPEPRAYCAAALLGGKLWIGGGTPNDGDFANLPTTWYSVDTRTGDVSALPSPGPATINPLVLPLGDELHVLPGGVWSNARRRLDPPVEIWIFSPATSQWRRKPLPGPLPRGLSGTPLDAHRAFVVGGVERLGPTTAIARATWIYDARTVTLTRAPDLPAPRLAAAVVIDAGHAFILGGEDGPRRRADTVWRLPFPENPSAR